VIFSFNYFQFSSLNILFKEIKYLEFINFQKNAEKSVRPEISNTKGEIFLHFWKFDFFTHVGPRHTQYFCTQYWYKSKKIFHPIFFSLWEYLFGDNSKYLEISLQYFEEKYIYIKMSFYLVIAILCAKILCVWIGP